MKFGNLVFLFFSATFASLSFVLVSRIQHAKRQEAHMLNRMESLTGQLEKLSSEFELKQDYMRRMISDEEFVEQIIREKTGLSKRNEVIFKFGN
jgi:cell division protein FtsB